VSLTERKRGFLIGGGSSEKNGLVPVHTSNGKRLGPNLERM
jgi:hypothetical protein